MRAKYSILKGGRKKKSADDEFFSSHNHAVEEELHVHTLNKRGDLVRGSPKSNQCSINNKTSLQLTWSDASQPVTQQYCSAVCCGKCLTNRDKRKWVKSRSPRSPSRIEHFSHGSSVFNRLFHFRLFRASRRKLGRLLQPQESISC